MVSLAALNKSIGQMRTLITAQVRHDVRNAASGEMEGEWVEVYQFWGAVEWVKGSERDNAMRVQAYDYCYIVARWDPRLNPTHRLVWAKYVLNVRSVTNVEERNHLMEIIAEKGAGT